MWKVNGTVFVKTRGYLSKNYFLSALKYISYHIEPISATNNILQWCSGTDLNFHYENCIQTMKSRALS